MTTATNGGRRVLDELFEAGLTRSSVADEQAVLGAMMLAGPGCARAGSRPAPGSITS
jgi:hypothetical protein